MLIVRKILAVLLIGVILGGCTASQTSDVSETEQTIENFQMIMNEGYSTTRFMPVTTVEKPGFVASFDEEMYLMDQANANTIYVLRADGEYKAKITLEGSIVQEPGPILVDETILLFDNKRGALIEYSNTGSLIQETVLELRNEDYTDIPVICSDIERIGNTVYLSIRSTISALGMVELGGSGEVFLVQSPWVGALSSDGDTLYATNFYEPTDIETTEGNKEQTIAGVSGTNAMYELRDGILNEVYAFLPKYAPSDFQVSNGEFFVTSGANFTLDRFDSVGNYVETLGNWSEYEKLSPLFGHLIRTTEGTFFIVFDHLNQMVKIEKTTAQ